MKSYATRNILIVAILIGILAGIGVTILRAQAQAERPPSPSQEVVSVRTQASYVRLSRQEMIEQADAILVGRVSGVSATQFNQDSGEIWEPQNANDTPIALHYVEVVISDSLLDNGIKLNEKITIAVLGTSPSDSNDSADHHLKEGDQVIVFLQSAELAWRNGTRPAWRFVALPAESALVLQEDGLYHDDWLDESPVTVDGLVSQIKQH